MKKAFLKWLYKNNTTQFNEFLIDEFIGNIPKDLRVPTIDFLSRGREKLERFFSIQAYNIQRRSISDPKNSEKYEGMLIEIRFLLSIIQKGSTEKVTTEIEEKKKDPIEGVESFLKEGKKLLSKEK